MPSKHQYFLSPSSFWSPLWQPYEYIPTLLFSFLSCLIELLFLHYHPNSLQSGQSRFRKSQALQNLGHFSLTAPGVWREMVRTVGSLCLQQELSLETTQRREFTALPKWSFRSASEFSYMQELHMVFQPLENALYCFRGYVILGTSWLKCKQDNTVCSTWRWYRKILR